MSRKVGKCEACNSEDVELVAHGLCHKCDMEYRRAKADSGRGRAEVRADKIRKRQEKFDSNLIAMKKLCNEFESSTLMMTEDVETLRQTILPYIEKIGWSLQPESVRDLDETLDGFGRRCPPDVEGVLSIRLAR
jgi:hypothetical protein